MNAPVMTKDGGTADYRTYQKLLVELKGSLDDKLKRIEELDAAVLSNTGDVEKLKADLEHLPAKVREDIENWLTTVPDAAGTQKRQSRQWVDMAKLGEDELGDRRQVKSDFVAAQPGVAYRMTLDSPAEAKAKAEKAAAGLNTNPAEGRGTAPGIAWAEAYSGDPWVDAGAWQHSPAEGKFQLLKTTGVEFGNAEGSRTAASFDTISGQVEASGHDVSTYVVRLLIGYEGLEDVPSLLTQLERFIMQAYLQKRAALTTAAVVAGKKDANSVASGAGTTGITATNGIEKLLSLPPKVSKYWPSMPSWVLSPDDEMALLAALIKAGVAIDPGNGVPRFGRWPVVTDTQAAGAGTDGNLTSFFGAWEDAVCQAQRGRLILDRSRAAVPGALAVFSAFRFAPIVYNNGAYAQIKIGAN